jgi:tetratricopeptide (TPR) repeat protein
MLRALRASLAHWRGANTDDSVVLARAHELETKGRHDAAAAVYDRLLLKNPVHVEALVQSAGLEGRRGKLDLARERLERALRLDPNRARSHADLGSVLLLAGDAAGATESLETALALDPSLAAAWNNLGLIHLRANCFAEAADAFAKAMETRSAVPDALRNFVSAKARLGHYAELRPLLETALAADPNDAEAHATLGLVELEGFAAPAAALAHFERALELHPQHAEWLVNRGIALHSLGRFDEALASHEAALAIDPDSHLGRYHRAMALLIQHRFAPAWDDFESRLKSEYLAARQLDVPLWTGEDLAGKTLLILAEQGLGDEIMFASCYRDVIARAKQCIIDCSPKLEAIFRRSFAGAIVHGGNQFDDLQWLAALPPPDLQVYAGSLPRFLRPQLADFPAHRGYLKADAEKIARWRARLDSLGAGLKVGVSWRGGTAVTRGARRSLRLDDLAPLFAVPGAQFVTLQYDAAENEVDDYRRRSGHALHDFADAISDYDETAALVASLDLVVSVCTAIIHLGGALGKPVWVMAPMVPEWRYGMRGESMPWYPGNRVLRQQREGDWQGVIARVAAELSALQAGGA